jgi:hypothetical protein
MKEILLTHLTALSGLGLVISAWLWSYGGRDGTPLGIRRYGSTLILAITLTATLLLRNLWNWYFLLLYPSLIVGTIFGYGGEKLIEKIIRRSVFALSCLLPGLLFCLILQGNSWSILPLHVGVGLWSIYIGIRNPIIASSEEFFVCNLLYLGLIMYPFVKQL